MNKRREFPRSVKVAVIKRATRAGVVLCEKCGAIAKRFEIDHINPDGLTGDPVIENAQLICEACFAEKNAADAERIARAKRQEAAHLGAKAPPKQPIRSAGFPKKPKRQPRPALPPRSLFERI